MPPDCRLLQSKDCSSIYLKAHVKSLFTKYVLSKLKELYKIILSLCDGSVVKNLLASAGDAGEVVCDLWVEKILSRRKWRPTPVFLPGKSHGQRSLEGYSPWGHKKVRYNLVNKQ